METLFVSRNPFPADSMTRCRYPHVPSFLKYVMNRRVVRFQYLEKLKEDDFSLELSKVFTYDYVTERIAPHLGLDDPTNISLTPHNCYSQQPIAQAIKYQGFDHLSEM
ncbi:ubiquitin carboxyl-terminal hydrolase 13-like isoform X1 [Papaver somniferum]|uniref:ubiquitin carboxyl-terminal hydrolase 13-like isoform X1 n=1 Tax=Papaver somniferum TaxID=3469 RepID=UPI000E7014DB|nr:ubiquitin carboxyl-terminal hydrolase 13-like isoform X1 [Papaver somniferum]